MHIMQLNANAVTVTEMPKLVSCGTIGHCYLYWYRGRHIADILIIPHCHVWVSSVQMFVVFLLIAVRVGSLLFAGTTVHQKDDVASLCTEAVTEIATGFSLVTSVVVDVRLTGHHTCPTETTGDMTKIPVHGLRSNMSASLHGADVLQEIKILLNEVFFCRLKQLKSMFVILASVFFSFKYHFSFSLSLTLTFSFSF